MTDKVSRPYEAEQDFLMPPSPRDWLPEDHLAYFISDVTLVTLGDVARKIGL